MAYGFLVWSGKDLGNASFSEKFRSLLAGGLNGRFFCCFLIVGIWD